MKGLTYYGPPPKPSETAAVLGPWYPPFLRERADGGGEDEDRFDRRPMLRVRQDAGVLATSARLRAQGAGEGRLGGPPRSRGEEPQRVPRERFPEPLEPLGKTSRVHLDLYTTDQEGEVERLIGIGATRYPQEYRPDDDDFIVLEDPDGNRFRVVQVPEQS